jgi:hypothetical protein
MRWKLGFGVLLTIAMTSALSVVLWKIFPAGADGQTAAAWFQAMGSIAAIGGAFFIGERQAAAALESVIAAQAAQGIARQKSILAIAEAADEHAGRIGDAFSKDDIFFALMSVYDKTIINGVVGALGNAPAHEVGSRDGVMALLSLRDHFVFLGIAVEAFLARPLNHPELRKGIEEFSQPHELKQRQHQIALGEQVLAGNVRIQLDQIHRHFISLKEAGRRSGLGVGKD